MGIASSLSLAHCWQSAPTVGASASMPHALSSSMPSVSDPMLTIRRSRASRPSFLFRVKSVPGERAHSSGLDATASIAASSTSATACHASLSTSGLPPSSGALTRPFSTARRAEIQL